MPVTKTIVNLLWQQRVVLACALTAAVFLVGVWHAPLIPVVIGCMAALSLKLISARRKPPRD
ncbi:MAG: hypothetical protein LAN62_01015 [Acidobacteriia bacterium]|nr:hypothetical protein [Terriglobia bacterium]